MEFLDKLLVLFGYPDRSAAALLAGDSPLRYCSARFAWKLPSWRLPDRGHVRDLVTESVDGARLPFSSSPRSHLFPSRLSKCPRSCLTMFLRDVSVANRRWWNSLLKCRRSFPFPRCSGLWSRTLTFQVLVVVELVEVFPVFSQDRVQQRLVVHGIFQQRLPSRSLTLLSRVIAEFFILHRRLPVCRVRQIKGYFALLPEGKKCALGLALGVGTAHRVEPIHAGGSAGGFLHGSTKQPNQQQRFRQVCVALLV